MSRSAHPWNRASPVCWFAVLIWSSDRRDVRHAVAVLAQQVGARPEQRVVAAAREDRRRAEQRVGERVPVREVLAPGRSETDRNLGAGVVALGVHRRALEGLHVEGETERLHVLLDQRRLVRVRIGLVGDGQDVGTLRCVTDPVPVPVVLRLGHLRLRRRDVPGGVRRGVRVVVGQQVVLERVDHDVAGDLTHGLTAAERPHARLIQGEVDRLADVDVVERWCRHVERDVPDGVRRVDVQQRLQRGVGRVLAQDLRRDDAVHDAVQLAGLDLVVQVVVVAADRDGEPVRVGGTQTVGRRVVARVANELDRLPRLVAREGRLLVRRNREVEVLGTHELVGPGGHQETAVVLRVALRRTERRVADRRDRCRGWHREQVRQVAGRLAQGDHEGAVVGRLEPLDGVRLAGAEVGEAVDDVVVEVVAAHRRVGVGLALERANDVPGRHRHVRHRVSVVDAGLQRERVRQSVLRDLRKRARDVGLQVRAALGRGLAVVRQERPEQAAPVPRPRDRVVLLLWVERGAHVAQHRELDRAAGLELAGRARRRRGPGRAGATAVIATARRGDEAESGDERQYAQISPHVTPLSSPCSSSYRCPGRARSSYRSFRRVVPRLPPGLLSRNAASPD